MTTMLRLPLLLVVFVSASGFVDATERPIIGILSQELSDSLDIVSPNSTSYIAASYVKFIESAGARVVPILINQTDAYYTSIFKSVNGILFPGGSASIRTSGYARAGALLYDLAIQANLNGDYFPVWGICLGFQMLTYLSAGKRSFLTQCNSYNRALNLQFTPDASPSKLFGAAGADVRTALANENITSNFHHSCITPENFTSSGLDKFYTTLSINQDDNNMTFISSIEARNFPIWGLQFHPEKNIFEWSGYSSVPHSPTAIRAGRYFADFFVNEARRNTHKFASTAEENSKLIYNYEPTYTGNASSSFVQCYFF